MGRTETQTPIWPKHKDLRLGGISPLNAPVLWQRVVQFCYTGSSFVVNSECDCASFVLCLFSVVLLLLGLDFWHAINNPVGVEFEIWYQIFHMFNMELLSSHLVAGLGSVTVRLSKNRRRPRLVSS